MHTCIRAAEVGTVYLLYFYWQPVIVVLNPEDVEVIRCCMPL